MHFISVNDELVDLKKKIRQLGKEIIKVEKIGNGNMSAFQLHYRNPGNDKTFVEYFWRHDLDNFLLQFEAAVRAGLK